MNFKVIRKFIVITLLCSIILHNSCSKEDISVDVEYSDKWSLIEIELLELINLERDVLLIPNGYVKRASLIRKDYFISIGEITHQNISHIIYLLKDKGFNNINEVLAFGYTSVEAVKNALFKSINHKTPLLDSKYKYVGISIGSDNENNMYYVIVLANK